MGRGGPLRRSRWLLSGIHAARHLRLAKGGSGGIIDITCPRRIAAPAGIRAHRCTLPRDETMILAGIPATTSGRTILDCAATASVREIVAMLNEAVVLGIPIRPSLPGILERNPGRRGVATAREALERFEPTSARTESELEDAFFDFLDRHGLPAPQANHRIETDVGILTVDLCWPDQRLVLEVDAPSTHGSRPRMLNDRRRDRALIRARWTPGRLMEEDLEDETRLAAEIRGLLGL